MKKMGLHTEGNWYKGNLHLHSTNSDGRKTPEETAKVYQDHGYHFIAFTEHEHYTWDSELNRDGFESCNQEADTFLTAEQLTANFQACKNNWRDDLAPNGMEGPTL